MDFTDKEISGKVLDHHGLVAATIHDLGLIEKIDQLIPISKEKGSKVTIGQRVASMILNGLGFVDERLYMFPDFLKNKPIERLLGEGLKAEDFNDDALGRGLDALHEYGVTSLFSELAFSIGSEQNLLGKSAHFDTSSLSVHGDYDLDEPAEDNELSSSSSSDKTNSAAETVTNNVASAAPKTPKITYGYSKDHRPDLKQVVINLATTGASGFPVWMESHSGNASDKVILRQAAERMKDLTQQLEKAPSFLYVADSAMYDSCVNNGGGMLWLSRVP